MVADANRPESVIANGPVLGAYEPFEYLDTTGGYEITLMSDRMAKSKSLPALLSGCWIAGVGRAGDLAHRVKE